MFVLSRGRDEKDVLRKLFVKSFLACQDIANEEFLNDLDNERWKGVVQGLAAVKDAFEEELARCGQPFTLEDLAK